MNRPLYPFQKKAYEYLLDTPRAALFMEMRLGKTLVVIRSLRSKSGPFLIVAPNDALIAWHKELETEHESFTRLAGSGKERDFQLIGDLQDFFHLQKPRYFLTNKESFLSLPRLASAPWQAVILDESTFIKNPKAKVTRFYCSNFKSAPIKIILTGTPAPESPLNYFQQLYFIDPRILQEKNFWEFRIKHFKPYIYDWHITPSSQQWLSSKLSQNAFLLKRSEAGLSRKKIFEIREIELPSSIRKIYDTVKSDFVFEYKNFFEKTDNAMTAFLWLRQITSGAYKNVHFHDLKIDCLLNLLQNELKNEKVVIWTNFLQEHNRILNSFLQNQISHFGISGNTLPERRREIVGSFCRCQNIQALVCQIQCATYGLDLSAAETSVYFSSPLSFLQRRQSEDRILSIKKTSPLLYIDIVAKDTLDEDILDMIKEKGIPQKVTDLIIRRLQNERKK